MIRVCQIVSGDLWAGAEVMVYQLLRGLRSYNALTLFVILLNEGRLAQEIRKEGIALHVLDENDKSLWSILFSVRKILQQCPPSIIHSHRYKENILAYLISKVTRKPTLISTQHGMPEIYGPELRLRYRLTSRFNFFLMSHCFDKLVGVSNDIENAFIEQYGFKKDRVTFIHNGVEMPEKLPFVSNRDNLVIGSSGRLLPVKDYPFMIEIAKVVCGRTNNIRFELAGDGPELPMLKRLVHSYGLEKFFEFKGHVEDISSFYRGLDLYINTSIHEGIPMSILEVMAYGLPVIAPRVGGLKEMIDSGAEGYLLEERNPKAFAEKCLLLLENKAMRQKMSFAARQKIVRQFSMEQMAKEYYHLYMELLNDTPPHLSPHS